MAQSLYCHYPVHSVSSVHQEKVWDVCCSCRSIPFSYRYRISPCSYLFFISVLTFPFIHSLFTLPYSHYCIFRFSCPPGTKFQQRSIVCDHSSQAIMKCWTLPLKQIRIFVQGFSSSKEFFWAELSIQPRNRFRQPIKPEPEFVNVSGAQKERFLGIDSWAPYV